jgi:cytochrome c oxidase subunit 2
MAEETVATQTGARTPDEVRPRGQASIVQMLVIGLIASVAGVVLGIAIDWFPDQGSVQAQKIDTLYDVLIVASVPVFVLVQVVVLFSVWKFRMRPGEENADGPPIHGNTTLEIIWTTIPAILLVALCSYAYVVLTDIEDAKANEMRVNVTGQQFTWSFEYPQAGGGQPVRSNVLYLPEGRPVHFYVKSKDVIHDFWIPEMRMKVDAVPGITTDYRLTPIKTGSYSVVCAELCGIGHAYMRQTAKVISASAFGTWLKGKQHGGAAGGGGGAAKVDAKALFVNGNGTSTACGSCHTLAAAGASGTVGPKLDAVLKGKDAAFIRQSIVKPDAQIAKGYQGGIMPKDFAQTLKPEELDALVNYLEKVAAK